MAPQLLPSAAAIASLLVACGGKASSPADDTTSFVGSWSCSVTTTQAITAPVSTTNSTTSDTNEVFATTPDGTLTGTLGDADAGSAAGCSLDYAISGSTADAVSGQSCPYFLPGWSLTGATFAVTGNSATMSMDISVTNGVGTGPDGGPATLSGTLTLSGTCTKS